MSYLLTMAEIEREIKNLKSKEVFARVKEILSVKDSPTVHFSHKGVGYVDPLDIIASRRGGEIIDRYIKEAKQKSAGKQPDKQP